MTKAGTTVLNALLAERDWLLADGATGTNYFALGLEAGEAPELWNVDAPEKVRDLHAAFIAAGSDIVLTNSFGGTRYRLKLHDAQDRVHELNKRAAELAREAADASGRQVVVAGSIGPTGELLEPVGSLSMADAVAAFQEQGRALLDGGADVLWSETISGEEELRAVAEAARNLDAPLCTTLSFDTAGRTMMGVTSTGFGGLSGSLAVIPRAIGANCGVGASDLLRTILGITEAAPEAIVVAKANAGIPKYVDGQIEYDGTPELMADYAVLARRAGARIIGGCCGTTPAHIAKMRAALEGYTSAPRPSLDEIEAVTGPFSSADDGSGGCGGGEAPARGRRGRRRAQS